MATKKKTTKKKKTSKKGDPNTVQPPPPAQHFVGKGYHSPGYGVAGSIARVELKGKEIPKRGDLVVIDHRLSSVISAEMKDDHCALHVLQNGDPPFKLPKPNED